MHEKECKILVKSFHHSDERLISKSMDDNLDIMLMGPPFKGTVVPNQLTEHAITEVPNSNVSVLIVHLICLRRSAATSRKIGIPEILILAIGTPTI